jgi:hypothetical protein
LDTGVRRRRARVHLRFIASLKLSFKFSPDYRGARSKEFSVGNRARLLSGGRIEREKREADMADSEIAVNVTEPNDANACFTLGMIYSSGAGVAVDLIEAHKWFNIAAMHGHSDAAPMRREIAGQMADAEIGRAQRAARDWLKAHPLPQPAQELRVAA